jgi:hypothetical protein
MTEKQRQMYIDYFNIPIRELNKEVVNEVLEILERPAYYYKLKDIKNIIPKTKRQSESNFGKTVEYVNIFLFLERQVKK